MNLIYQLGFCPGQFMGGNLDFVEKIFKSQNFDAKTKVNNLKKMTSK